MRPTTVAGLITVALLLIFPALSSADSSTSLTVVGTSDVSDSGLMQNVIQPQFHAAFPQYTFKYIGTATGNAINSAESGSQGASVLIVHAPSLENQFVGNGFSDEPFGRAIFVNDFVLGGPTGDPAGVAGNAAHNIVQAFADVATVGINGGGTPLATFVSRGGTPGTTVEEHQIWQLVDSSGLAPSGLLLCAVSAANGGGETPIASGQGVTASGQQCPNSGALPSGAALPPWYVTTGDTQGPNVVLANACNGFPSGANSCYVFSDRGTFDYLSAGNGAAAANSPAGIPNLEIVTRGPQSDSAPGGADLLVNYFHAYIINPSKPGETVNPTAAQDFVNLLTSPEIQSRLQFYLNDTSDPAGPPFVADASPHITASGLPGIAGGGRHVTVTGTVTNAEPGYPAIDSKHVTVDEIEGTLPVPVGSGSTDSNGHYSVSFVPSSGGSYEVTTQQIQQIENPDLTPVFGDLVSPGASRTMSMRVRGSVSVASAKASAGGVTVTGPIAPAAPDGNSEITLLARPQGSTGAFTEIGGEGLVTGQSSFAANGVLRPGNWEVEARYGDPGQLVSATSTAVEVSVPQSTTTAGLTKATVSHGSLKLAGKLSQAAGAGGAKVELFALRAVKLTSTRHARRAAAAAAGGFHRIAQTTVKQGKTSFTIRAKLQRGYRWILQLEDVQSGQAASFSKLKTIAVR